MSTMKLSSTVGQLVTERPGRARVFESFGIDYCCGGKKLLAQACSEKGLDPVIVLNVLDAFDGQEPSVAIGSCLRPLARTPIAATSASPFVRNGVRPVSLKRQHSFTRVQLRSIGREASSA